jgi:hypothetical protein
VENPGRRGREAPVAVAFEPLVPSRRSGSGYPHSRYPFPPCTARGSAAPLPHSHRGVHHALTVEDDTESFVTRPETPSRGLSNPSSRRDAQDRATRTAGTRPPLPARHAAQPRPCHPATVASNLRGTALV